MERVTEYEMFEASYEVDPFQDMEEIPYIPCQYPSYYANYCHDQRNSIRSHSPVTSSKDNIDLE